MSPEAALIRQGSRWLPVAALALTCLLALAPLPARSEGEVAAELVATGLARPLFAASPEGDGRLFIVERAGTIRILLGGSVFASPFLDIRALVSTSGERGLLGLAFDPDYPRTGLFYVHYSNRSGDSVIARFRVSDDPDRADPDSQEVLLVVDQPFPNHNGGSIAFGADGKLYIGLGDGGAGFDPNELAQDPKSLLGKMLRLDVSSGPGQPFAIPPDNPFVQDPDVLDEIWSFGLRNPYRWSFDRETGDMWIGDVGQGRREEIDFEPAGDPGGRNYGWDVMEGSLCNNLDPAPAPPCNDPSLTLPVFEYAHVFGLCSVTGGYVYRGANPDIQGQYFFGDFCTGVVWSYDLESNQVRLRTGELAPAAGQRFRLVGFGENGAGELHIVNSLQSGASGDVYRIRSPEPACSDGFDNDGDGLADADDPACADPLQDGELPRNDLAVDVRPSQLNPRSNGVVPVSVLASTRYQLWRADPETLVFGPDATPRAHPQGPHPSDPDDDGHEDWTVHFRMQGSGLEDGDTEACVRIEIARVPFEGCDAVTIPPGATVEPAEAGAPTLATASTASAASVDDSDPPVLQYVPADEGCSIWNDCGWIWAPPQPAAVAEGDAGDPPVAEDVASVPALSRLGFLLLVAALLAAGAARRRNGIP